MKRIYIKPSINSCSFSLSSHILELSSEEIKPGTGELPDDADAKEREFFELLNSFDEESQPKNGLW